MSFPNEEKACPVCGTYGCKSCIAFEAQVWLVEDEPGDAFRKIKKFRDQVRSESRKFKRNSRLL